MILMELQFVIADVLGVHGEGRRRGSETCAAHSAQEKAAMSSCEFRPSGPRELKKNNA
jgi:hypothetical protein